MALLLFILSLSLSSFECVCSWIITIDHFKLSFFCFWPFHIFNMLVWDFWVALVCLYICGSCKIMKKNFFKLVPNDFITAFVISNLDLSNSNIWQDYPHLWMWKCVLNLLDYGSWYCMTYLTVFSIRTLYIKFFFEGIKFHDRPLIINQVSHKYYFLVTPSLCK